MIIFQFQIIFKLKNITENLIPISLSTHTHTHSKQTRSIWTDYLCGPSIKLFSFDIYHINNDFQKKNVCFQSTRSQIVEYQSQILERAQNSFQHFFSTFK